MEEIFMKYGKILFLLLAICIVPLMATDLEKEFRVKAGQELIVDIERGGSVEVLGWDKNVAQILIEFDGYDCDPSEIKLEQKGDRIYVGIESGLFDSHNNCDYTTTVRVPYEFNLDVETKGGNVEINDIVGIISGRTMGGNLDFSGLSGTLKFSTMGGNINIKDSKVNGKVSTMGGNLEMLNISGSLSGKSMGGNITYDHKGKVDKDEQPPKYSTMGGNIIIGNAPLGANIKTMGGNISVDRAGDFVKAKTMGGNISIGKVSGGVDLKTMGGDISAIILENETALSQDISMESHGGDIDLDISEEYSMNFDLEVKITKKWAKDFKIVSDFDFEEIRKMDKQLLSHDDEIIVGTGEVNGGDHSVKLRTVNGNITIRKLK